MTQGSVGESVPRASQQTADGTGAWQDTERIREVLMRAVACACPGSMADWRDDIVQASLLRVVALRGRDEHHEIRSSSYLWRVAFTATVDELRRAGRRREVSLEEIDVDAKLLDRGVDPESAAAGRELGGEIRDCLGRLIRPRRLAVMLHLYGFTAEEAQPVLGWGVKRVRNLTYRGLSDLRTCLEAKGLRP